MTVQRTLAAICWALIMIGMTVTIIVGCTKMQHQQQPPTPVPSYSNVQLPTL